MASYTTGQAGGQIQQLANIPAAYEGDALEMARAQRLAQMLSTPEPAQGQMVSGRYVKPSWTQSLAQLVQAGTGAYFADQADKQNQSLAKKIREGETSALADFMATKQGRPAVPEQVTEMAGPYGQSGSGANIPMPTATVAGREAIPANPMMANANLYADPRASNRLRDMAFTKIIADPEAFTLSEGQKRLVANPDGTFREVASGGQKLPATLDVAVSLIPNLPRDSSKWTDAQAKQVENKVLQLEAAKASVTHVNMPSGEERKAGFMSNILDRNILQMQNALGVDPKAVKPNVPASIVEAVTGPNLLSRSMTPVQRQIVEDSQLDVLDAALTLRTGAAYTPVQLNAMRATYFPVLGDKPAAVTAKKERLETLLEGAFIAAGRATPARVSALPPKAPPAPNINKELNLPAINKPRFLGFETPATGNQ
jgi:hypothetical protein